MWKAIISGTGIHDLLTPGGGQAIQLCAPEGLQAMEMVSEPLCPREGMSVRQIKNC